MSTKIDESCILLFDIEHDQTYKENNVIFWGASKSFIQNNKSLENLSILSVSIDTDIILMLYKYFEYTKKIISKAKDLNFLFHMCRLDKKNIKHLKILEDSNISIISNEELLIKIKKTKGKK